MYQGVDGRTYESYSDEAIMERDAGILPSNQDPYSPDYYENFAPVNPWEDDDDDDVWD